MLPPDLATLEGITLDGDEPVFNEPWEAQAFAMTLSLHEKGHFTWKEWAQVLSEEIHSGEDQEYYRHWLTALEKLVSQKNLTSKEALETRRTEWQKAAKNTPHGEVIVLGRGKH